MSPGSGSNADLHPLACQQVKMLLLRVLGFRDRGACPLCAVKAPALSPHANRCRQVSTMVHDASVTLPTSHGRIWELKPAARKELQAGQGHDAR